MSTGSALRANRRGNIGVLIFLSIAIPLATGAAMPKLITGAHWQLLAEAVATAVAAVSVNVLLGYTGQLSLGHAGLLGAGAFASGVITSRADLPMALGMLTSIAVGAAVALVIGLPALRLRGLYLGIVTLVFGVAMEYTVLPGNWLTGGGGSAGFPLPRRIIGSHFLTDTQMDSATYLAICLVLLVVVCVIDDNVVRTRLGRAMRTIRENESVAAAYGVDVARYKLLGFVVSGGMAGLSGALNGHAQYSVSSESYTLLLSLQLLTIAVVGGLGHRRAIVGTAIAFWLIPQMIGSLQGYQYAVGGLLLLVTVTRNPGGLGALPVVLREHRAARRARVDEDDDEQQLPELPGPSDVVRASTGAENLLEVENLTVRYGGLAALRDASIVVPRGRIVGLIGPNGAGKSTLFNAVSGLVRCDTGRIRYNGREVQQLRADQRARLGIARSFQHVGLALDLTVFENLLMAQHQLAAYGDTAALVMTPSVARSEHVMAERADAAIRVMGFDDHRDKVARNLSGGQQRLVEMACLLITGPELVMLDEPSAGMAPAAAERLAERLRDLRDGLGRTVLLIEHNLPLVFDCCDDVYVLDAGSVIASGSVADVTADPRVIDAYFGQMEPPAPKQRRASPGRAKAVAR